MMYNDHGERVYSQDEVNEIKRSLDRARPMRDGQSTHRTLIDVMNWYCVKCPMSDYAIHITRMNTGVNLSFIKNGTELVFQCLEAPNIQCAYEELFEFIVSKAFPE